MSQKLKFFAIFLNIFTQIVCQKRIFFGNDAEKSKFPFMAIVRAPAFDVTCGGSLISSRFILTAAHCVMNLDPDYDDAIVFITLGAHLYYDSKKTEKHRKEISSKVFKMHEKFNPKTIENDIAIVELPEPVKFSGFIQPIKISKVTDIKGARDVTVVGWGHFNDTRIFARVLQTAKMKTVAFNQCQKFRSFYVEKLTKDNICVIGRENKADEAKMICNGDSGGPLIDDKTGELLGIASYVKDALNGKKLGGNDCRDGKVPGVFVKVSSHLNWIKENTDVKL